MGLCSWQLGGSLRANGHWQSAEEGPQLMNGLIYQDYNSMSQFSFGLLGEVGQPFKLRYHAGTYKSQFRQDIWANDTNIPLMIIPHAILKFTDYFSVDISDLANHPFTCNYNVTLENSTFTVTMQAGSTFTFDALVVKIPKTDMLTYTYHTTSYYYLPDFDIAFSGITCAIEIGADRKFQTAQKVYVGQLEQQSEPQQGTDLWDFTLIDTEPFVTITHYDVSDYATAELSGSIGMKEFGNYREGFLMLSPFAFQSYKTASGAITGQSTLFQSMFSNAALSAVSDNGIVGSGESEASIFNFASKFANSEFEITSQKLWRQYFTIALIDSISSGTAPYNTWSWTKKLDKE